MALINQHGADVTNIHHAYASWVGKIVGVNIGDGKIISGTVMVPEIDQDHNLVLVATALGWTTVRGMDTHRSDFINHVIED